MKRILSIAILVLMLCLLTSCLTFTDAEPTLVGGWTTSIDGNTCNMYFTEDGFYVIEGESSDTFYCEFGYYETDEQSLYIDGNYDCEFLFDGKTLILGNKTFSRTTKKAVNNSAKLAGVWENDYYMLGFATDGLVVSQGSYMNCKNYSIEEDSIVINGAYTDYLIVNNSLYLRSFDFLKERDTIKLKRKSSEGSNKTGMNILCSGGPWFYQDLGSYDISGVLYSFSTNGYFQGTEYSNGNPGSTKSGTFTLDGNRIRLSTGGTLIFAYIDSTPFGYT